MELTKTKFTSIILAITFISVLLTGTVFYVLAPSATNTIYVEQGVYPGAPSYTVWRVDSTYYAKDANGEVDHVGTNVSYIVQQIVNSLSSGGKIFFEQGRYVFDSEVTISQQGLYIEGEATGYTTYGTNFDYTGSGILFRYSAPTHKFFGGISDLTMTGTDQAGSIAINIEKFYSDLWFERVFIANFEHGIKIRGGDGDAGEAKVWNIWIKKCLIENNLGFGIWLTDTSDVNHTISRVQIDSCHFYNNNNSLYVGDQWVFNLEFSGNTVEQERKESIYLLGGRRVLITNNRIFDIGTNALNTYSAIYISNASGGSPPNDITITDNVIGNHWIENQSRYAIQLEQHCDHIRISDNMLETWKTASPTEPIYQDSVGTDIVIEHNQGFITEARGTASGTTPITVTHTLDDVPTNIRVTPTSSAGNFYVNTVGANTFRINFDGGGTVAFYWEARCVTDV